MWRDIEADCSQVAFHQRVHAGDDEKHAWKGSENKYSYVPNKRIDMFIFSKQIRLLEPVLTPITAVLMSISTSKRL